MSLFSGDGYKPIPTPLFSGDGYKTIPTPEPLTTPTGETPNLIKATLRGKNIDLQFDSALSDTLPSIEKFTLRHGDREYRIVDAEIRSFDGVVTLQAEKELDPTVSITLDYSDNQPTKQNKS